MFNWLREETLRMDKLFDECIQKWRHDLFPIVERIASDRHWRLLPVSTLAVNQLLGSSPVLSAQMGVMFRLFYLGGFVHSLVKNDHEGQVYDEELQFNILIGDFIFGRALFLLGEMGQELLLPEFADMIAEVNEGNTLALNEEDRTSANVISKREAVYYRYAFRTAGIVNGLNQQELELAERAGYQLGMAVSSYCKGGKDHESYAIEFKRYLAQLKGKLGVSQFNPLEVWMEEFVAVHRLQSAVG